MDQWLQLITISKIAKSMLKSLKFHNLLSKQLISKELFIKYMHIKQRKIPWPKEEQNLYVLEA